MHGISDDYTEAVRQKYYRMRKAYAKNGVFLGKLRKNRSDDRGGFVRGWTGNKETVPILFEEWGCQ